MKTTMAQFRNFIFLMMYPLMACACVLEFEGSDLSTAQPLLSGSQLADLSSISIIALRERTYGQGPIEIIDRLDRICTSLEAAGDRPRQATRLLAQYPSEGQTIYARIDVPFEAQPEAGYPVMIFTHGWVGAENAPDWHFGCTTESSYGDHYGSLINAWAEAGYVVLVPGYRGHGTIKGVLADGHQDMLAWDTGAYLMPSFYAVDVMNLMASATSSGGLSVWDETGAQQTIQIDASRVLINGHSQGGDVALTVLAATGEDAASGLELAGGSIWAGNIADRFEQLATFEAMSTSPEAFLSGDGTWTGTDTGEDGSRNPNFVFGFPPDWVASPHPTDWTWQTETFSRANVKAALEAKAGDMYETLNQQITTFGDLSWQFKSDQAGRVSIDHDERLTAEMLKIGGFHVPAYLSEPLNLHYSDRDYYSLPVWNERLCEKTNAIGGQCQAFEYAGNTHSLGLSEHDWFSPPGAIAGYKTFIKRDLCSFDPIVAQTNSGDDCQHGDMR